MVQERRSLLDVLAEEGAEILDDLVRGLSELPLYAELDKGRDG